MDFAQTANQALIAGLAGAQVDPRQVSRIFSTPFGITGPANINYTITDPATGASYVVPAGKKLLMLGVLYTSTAAGGLICYLGYADNNVGQGSATAFTNARNGFLGVAYNSIPQRDNCYVECPAGKYPWVAINAGAATLYGSIFCVEVAV